MELIHRGILAREFIPMVEENFREEADLRAGGLTSGDRYFCNPNFDAEIEALPGTYKNEADKKYGPINSGEYLAARLESTIYG